MRELRKSLWCATWLLCGLALGSVSKPEPLVELPARATAEHRLSAILRLSDKPADVLRAWQIGTGSFRVPAADRITRGAPIVAFVFFTGCMPDENGMCNASADFTIRKPDGSMYATFEDRDLWKGKPAPPEGTVRLSAEHVGVIIEPEDPLGEYEFHVSIHDLNAGTSSS